MLEDEEEELVLLNLEDVTFAARADGAGRDLTLTVGAPSLCVSIAICLNAKLVNTVLVGNLQEGIQTSPY